MSSNTPSPSPTQPPPPPLQRRPAGGSDEHCPPAPQAYDPPPRQQPVPTPQPEPDSRKRSDDGDPLSRSPPRRHAGDDARTARRRHRLGRNGPPGRHPLLHPGPQHPLQPQVPPQDPLGPDQGRSSLRQPDRQSETT